MSKQVIEKKYFELITAGHYIDVMNSDSQWAMAKVIQKDKKYVWVAYDGYMNKQDQLFVNSYRVAPLRANTEGFTGNLMKIYRQNIPKIQEFKNYLQIAREKFFDQQKAKAFQITQLIRGELFVYVHDLICRESTLTETEIKETNSFLQSFIDLILKVIEKALDYREDYLALPLTANKLLYLSNPKVALIQSLQELLILLQLIVKADSFKYVNLWKCNKGITSQQKLAEYFSERKGLLRLHQIFISNDKNGKWYPSSIRKSIYKILMRYTYFKVNFVMQPLPKYEVKDFQQFYSIYPFMWRCSPEILFENQFIDFSIRLLLTNSPFDAKLKSIQEIKKVLEGKNSFQFLDKSKILAKIDQMGVLEQLLDNKNFNPEVFKRFVPILNMLGKIKSLNMKHIHTLFQIVKFRHESETGIIFDIISEICQFAPSSLLDNVYTEICKIDINSEQTMKFIKTFTIKAVQNLSKQKSLFSGFFGKKKGSAKYAYYGLNLIFKECQDEGRISRQMILFALGIIKELLSESPLAQERWNHLVACTQFIKKRKNFGQSIKLICLIISTFEETNFFTEDRKKVVQKLEGKYNVIDHVVEGFKNIEAISQSKMTHSECYQYFYQLVDAISPFIKVPLKANQIEYLWYKGDSTLLLNYLRKSKPNQKFKKIITSEVIEEIFTLIFKKSSFYKRNLTFQQFETVYELFLAYHLEKQNITVNTKDGLVRYNKDNLLGLDYFIYFLTNSKDQKNFQKTAKNTIQLILRPNQGKIFTSETILEQKVTAWKNMFKRCIQKLISNPKKCLNFIQIFYSSIEGRLYKQINTTDNSNLDILVQCSEQEKSISIERFSTIYRLRKLIKQKFKLDCDFNLFNVKINKTITFEEQEDFSVNAMPLVNNGRAVTIKVQLKSNKHHQQQMACMLFKLEIQKEQNLYFMLFKIVEENDLSPEIESLFWKSIELLPLNKLMMTEVQKCGSFTLQKWMNYFSTVSDSSLQYKLSIVLNLIKNSQKWVFKMEQTHGLLAIILVFIKTVQKWNFSFENEILSLKIIQVTEKIYQKCTKKQLESDILKQMNQTIIKSLEKEFTSETIQEKQNQNSQSPKFLTKNKITLDLVNKLLSVYLSNLKLLMNKNQIEIQHIKIETFLKILDYGLFLKKTQSSQKFAEEVSISLNFAIYDNLQNKRKILQYLIERLNLQKLQKKQRTQNYFKFFITILYSFEQLNNQLQNAQNSKNITNELQAIFEFVNKVIEDSQLKDEDKPIQQIIFGSLSLLKFILSKTDEKFLVDSKFVFQKLVNFFLLPTTMSGSKRIKSEKNKKILFEILKKISFQDSTVLSILIEKLRPFLQKNNYRKNSILSWNLHFENSQKKLFVGLQNLGATCYINCLFQQLFMIEQFRESFISIESRFYKPQLEKNEIYQLQKIFYTLKFGDQKSDTTKNFCSSFITFQGEPINPMVQSDADQFFNTLMDRIQSFLKQTSHSDILQKTFQGHLSNQLNCQGCPHRSEKIEPFTSIGVNLKNKKTLEEALKGYVEGQILDGDNAYYCEICDKKVRTLKRLCVKELPNILVIVLKRFEYDFDSYKKIKINSYLEFPERLNMTEYTSEYMESKSIQKMEIPNSDQKIKINENKNVFHLRGSVIHAGYAEAGHYYSFIKDKQKWYEFNDQYIKETNYAKVQQEGFGGDDKESSDQIKLEKYKNAYILFYERETSPAQSIQENQKSKDLQLKDLPIIAQSKQPQDFSKCMTQNISSENLQTNIFSTLLDPNFIHFVENLYILENLQVQKFIFLYFHTVILRDKLKYEYATNYFRILTRYLLEKPQSNVKKNFKNEIKGVENEIKVEENHKYVQDSPKPSEETHTQTDNENMKTQQDLKTIQQLPIQIQQCLKANQQNNIQPQKSQKDASDEISKDERIGDWFLQQIDRAYIREFLIEAPKSIRFVCVSLILTAIEQNAKIPEQLPLMLVSSMRKTGMSPFGLIFKALLKRKQILHQLKQLDYFTLVCCTLFNDKKSDPKSIPASERRTQTYFGSECSEVEAEKEKCSAALLQSLQSFNGLNIELILKANQLFSFRKTNKMLMQKLAQIICQNIKDGSKDINDVIGYIKMLEERISASSCGKEFVEKYLFFMRYLVFSSADISLKTKIYELVTDSFQNFILTVSRLYEPLDWISRQITKIASKNQEFKNCWKSKVSSNPNLKLEIQSWLREVQKPEYISVKDEFFQKIRSMQLKQKSQFLRKYSKKMRAKTAWMFDSTNQESIQGENSDLESMKQGEIIQVRNKSFKIREKFGSGVIYLASYPDKEDQLWIYLQKNQIQTFNSL